MTRFKSVVTSLWVTFIFCFSGNVLAVSGQLEAAESQALEILLLLSESKSEAFLDGSGKFESPTFALFAADERRHSKSLKDVAEHYSLDENRDEWVCYQVLLQVDGLDLLCNPFSADFLWRDEWETFLPGAAYLEEMIIRELGKALAQTDEQTLIDVYTQMLDATYLHLLRFAKMLNPHPMDYEAQLLDPIEVDSMLEKADVLLSENFEINAGLNDLWYDPATNGQGISVSVFEDTRTIFLGWFTYDTELPDTGSTAILGDPGQRWLAAQGIYEGKQAELEVYSSSGGLFDASPPHPEPVSVGSIILRFEDCNSGIVHYEFPAIGRSGSIPIERLAPDNIAHCEMDRPAASSQVDSDDGVPLPSTGPCYVSEGAVPTTIKRLFAVWGSSSSDVFAVGGSATILHYNGKDWTPMIWGGGFGLEGVWGSSPTNVYAVGGYDGFGLALGKILHYDGICWREVFSTQEFQFTDVWGSSSHDVYATTSRGAMLHFDGTSWTPMRVESGAAAADGANGVWGTGSSDVFVVDANTIWHYDGMSWQLAASVDASSLRRVWGSSSTNVYAVGQHYTPTQTLAAVWRYDGDRWEFVPSDIEGDRWDVWGSDSNNLYIVGNSSSEGLITHYNGMTWNTIRVAVTPTLQGVWGSNRNDVYAVGGGARNGFCCSGAGTILHFNGNDWQIVMEQGRFK